jgi:hypothetical protein
MFFITDWKGIERQASQEKIELANKRNSVSGGTSVKHLQLRRLCGDTSSTDDPEIVIMYHIRLFFSL